MSLLLMAAGFYLFTGLTIIMQPRRYVHMSTNEAQPQSGSARGSTAAPSGAKRCCSQGGNVPGRVRVSLPTGGSLGLLFGKCRLPGVQRRAACLHFPSARAHFSPESSGPAEDLINVGLPQFSCCAVF